MRELCELYAKGDLRSHVYKRFGLKDTNRAMKVMKEVGIDISHHVPKSVNGYLGDSWDYVITVCGGANESCPAFIGDVKHRLHIGFDDPSKVNGTEGFVLSESRRVRDEIKEKFYELYSNKIRNQL